MAGGCLFNKLSSAAELSCVAQVVWPKAALTLCVHCSLSGIADAPVAPSSCKAQGKPTNGLAANKKNQLVDTIVTALYPLPAVSTGSGGHAASAACPASGAAP